MEGLEGLKALATRPPKLGGMASPALEPEGDEDPARAQALERADALIQAVKAGDREALADVLEELAGGGGAEE